MAEEDIRVVAAHALEICGLVGRDLLRRTTFFVEYVINPHSNANRISHMRDQIRSLDAQCQRRIVDIMDEIVHLGGFDIHEAVDFGLRGGAGIAGERRGGAAEEDTEVGVE